MSSEVQCPDCGGVWVIENPSGGEMICPVCMTRIPIEAPAAAPQAPAAESAPAPAYGGSETMVCPRCNFHFHPAKAASAGNSPRQTVLVVDDLEYFRKIALDALSPAFEVRTAATHDEAHAIIEQGGIDLVILDLTLEGGGGGRQLLTKLVPKPCPILIFTAEDESEMYGDGWDELARLGADDIVIKGMNVADVLLRKAGALLGASVDPEILD